MNTAFVRALCDKISAVASLSATVQRVNLGSRCCLAGWAPRPEVAVTRNLQTLSWALEPLQHPQLYRGCVKHPSLYWQPIGQCMPLSSLRLSSSQPEAQRSQRPSSGLVDKLRRPCQRGTSPDEARRLHSMEEWQACTHPNTLYRHTMTMHTSACM